MCFTFDKDGTVLVRCSGAEGTVVIPEGVKRIGEGAFEYRYKVTEIILPESLKVIGERAFQGSGITEIRIPESVEEIGAYAFAGTPLREVTLPESINVLAESAFRYCRHLKSVRFPKHMERIEPDMFNDCGKLREVQLPEDLREIGAHAFSGCTSIEYLDFPESLSVLEDGVFMRCISLMDVVLPANVSTLGNNLFCRCEQIRSITLPNGIRSLGKGIFYQCLQLATIRIEGRPESEAIFLNEIMWTNCYGLKRIIAPEIPVTKLHRSVRKQAVVGIADYLAKQGAVRGEVLETYLEEMKKGRGEYMELLPSERNLLELFLEQGILTEAEIIRLTDKAIEGNNTEIRAMLMNYREGERKEAGDPFAEILNAL